MRAGEAALPHRVSRTQECQTATLGFSGVALEVDWLGVS
jgi:hypothetical protein